MRRASRLARRLFHLEEAWKTGPRAAAIGQAALPYRGERPEKTIALKRYGGRESADGAYGSSFDYLVGAGEQPGWDVEAECLGSLEIDDQLVIGRRLHWQLGRLLAFKDPIDVAGRAPVRGLISVHF
jgi:hypothetical protein